MINKNLGPVRQLVFYFHLQDLWGILFMGNAFLNSESSHFSDIQAFNLILLGILYLTVRILSGLSQYIQLTVVLGLLFYFLGEAIAGLGYDGLLACLLPLSLSLALRANDAPSKRYLVVPVLSGFCTFLVLTLIPASMNPCCWFIAGIGCYVVVLYHFRTFRSYKLLLRWYPKRVIFFTLLLFVLLFKIGDSMYTSMKNPEADCTFLWEQSVGLIRRSPDQGYGLGSFSQLVSTPHLSAER